MLFDIGNGVVLALVVVFVSAVAEVVVTGVFVCGAVGTSVCL